MKSNFCVSINEMISREVANSFKITPVGDYCKVTTPFFNHNRDLFEFYIKDETDRIVISDAGFCFDEIEMIYGKVRNLEEKIDSAISSTSAKLAGKDITIETDYDMLHDAIFEIINASYRVMNSAVHKAKTKPHFASHVLQIIQAAHIPFQKDVQIKGRTAFQHRFDFSVQTKQHGTSLVRAVPKPSNPDVLASFMYAITDLEDDTQKKIMVTKNDELKKTKQGFQSYSNVAIFSDEQFSEFLSA